MKKFYVFLSLLYFAVTCLNYSQNESQHHLTVELLAGSSISSIGVYEDDDMNIIGFTGESRIMWEPEKLLRIGFETGFLHLAHSKEELINTEFGVTNRSNSLNAYPLMMIFNMKIWKLEAILGLGAAFVTSKINAFNDISESSVITSVKMYGLGYSMKLTEKLGIGCEFKYFAFSTPQLLLGTVEVKCKYTFASW